MHKKTTKTQQQQKFRLFGYGFWLKIVSEKSSKNTFGRHLSVFKRIRSDMFIFVVVAAMRKCVLVCVGCVVVNGIVIYRLHDDTVPETIELRAKSKKSDIFKLNGILMFTFY